jgi:hypothetical protein
LFKLSYASERGVLTVAGLRQPADAMQQMPSMSHAGCLLPMIEQPLIMYDNLNHWFVIFPVNLTSMACF